MKLKGANLLELSLSIAFALIILATSLQLIQEATDRINKAYTLYNFQQHSFNALLKIKNIKHWPWETTNKTNEMNIVLSNNSEVLVDYYSFNDGQWTPESNPESIKKFTITNNQSSKDLSIYTTDHKSISNLKNSLITLYYALKEYKTLNQVYPPTQQLNYLTESNILINLPNNPYTERDLNISNKNITDWSYINANGQITLYAYTHPEIILTFN